MKRLLPLALVVALLPGCASWFGVVMTSEADLATLHTMVGKSASVDAKAEVVTAEYAAGMEKSLVKWSDDSANQATDWEILNLETKGLQSQNDLMRGLLGDKAPAPFVVSAEAVKGIYATRGKMLAENRKVAHDLAVAYTGNQVFADQQFIHGWLRKWLDAFLSKEDAKARLKSDAESVLTETGILKPTTPAPAPTPTDGGP